MLMLEGFLQGLWVGVLAAVVWAVLSGLTGWNWMTPFNMWVFVGAGLIGILVKAIDSSPGGEK